MNPKPDNNPTTLRPGGRRLFLTTQMVVGALSWTSHAELIRHWPFDNSLAESVANDDGTAVGAISFAPDRNGNPDSALSVDGSLAQYVSVPGGGGLNALSTGTIACWVKWSGPQDEGFGFSFGAILARQNNGAWSNHIIALNAADPATATLLWRPYAAPSANTAVTGATPVGNDTWRHIAITFADGDHKFYLDGTLDGSGTTAPEGSSFIRDDASIPLGIGAWYGDGNSFSTSTIDDLMIFDTVLSEGEIQALLNPSSSLQLSVQSSGNDLTFTWNSRNGKVYDLLSSTDPEGDGAPDTWSPITGQEGIAAIPPSNMVTISRPADPTRLYVVRERNAPAPIFSEDFESGAAGWATGNDGTPGTDWSLGDPSTAPNNEDNVPDAAFSPDNCYGANLLTDYANGADVSLYSPTIAIPAGGASLTMQQWIDTDENGFDFGTINILDADNADSLIATLQTNIVGETQTWQGFAMALPASANGKNIKLQFRFTSNADGTNWGGWYVDDIAITPN